MPNIAVALRDWSTRRQDAVRGVYDFAKSIADWRVASFDRVPDQRLVDEVRLWGADAVITCLDGACPEVVDTFGQCELPVVNIGVPCGTLPSVQVDPNMAARLAVDSLGGHLSSIALVTTVDDDPAHAALATLATQRSVEYRRVFLPFDWRQFNSPQPHGCEQLTGWLQRSQPLGIVASCDFTAVFLRRLAAQLDFDVPGQISIVSLRDAWSCALPETSVSAIVEPTHELGFQAARRIRRILDGYPASTSPQMVEPIECITRGSTSEQRYDESIARALTFILDNAARGITVADVMAFQKTSRVTFERRFRADVGRSPGEEIRRVRLDKAKDLLLTTSDSIASIGRKCGFGTVAKFSAFFKNCEGISPSKFRRASSDESA